MTTINTTIEPSLLKRLNGELRILKRSPPQHIDAYLDEKTMMVWYFLIKGPEFSDFTGGYYIGKIILNPGYPYTPPDFMMLTPNGRFQVGKKICLSNTGFHSDQWSPSWTICANLIGVLSIMLDDNDDGIAHEHKSKGEREILAKNSVKYNMDNYSDIFVNFKRFIDSNGNPISNNPIIVNKQLDEPLNESVNESINESVNESINKPVNDKCMLPKKKSKSNKPLIETLDLNSVDKINLSDTETKYKKLIGENNLV